MMNACLVSKCCSDTHQTVLYCRYFDDENNNALTICSLFNDRKDKLITAFNAAQVYHPKPVLTEGRVLLGGLGAATISLGLITAFGSVLGVLAMPVAMIAMLHLVFGDGRRERKHKKPYRAAIANVAQKQKLLPGPTQ